MAFAHKNKTFATLLAAVFGGIGLHRFYLHGFRDFWGWAHLSTLVLAALLILAGGKHPMLFLAMPFALSVMAGFIEALVIGLTPDEKWDAQYNAASGTSSASGWPLAVLLVLTVGGGALVVIAVIARTFDLLYTGGAYG